jgi:hypothetical protein
MGRAGESANTREEPKNLRPYVDEFRTASSHWLLRRDRRSGQRRSM